MEYEKPPENILTSLNIHYVILSVTNPFGLNVKKYIKTCYKLFLKKRPQLYLTRFYI